LKKVLTMGFSVFQFLKKNKIEIENDITQADTTHFECVIKHFKADRFISQG